MLETGVEATNGTKNYDMGHGVVTAELNACSSVPFLILILLAYQQYLFWSSLHLEMVSSFDFWDILSFPVCPHWMPLLRLLLDPPHLPNVPILEP